MSANSDFLPADAVAEVVDRPRGVPAELAGRPRSGGARFVNCRSVASILVLVLPLFACAAGDGVRFQVISMERPPEGIGLPPPADYEPCFRGEARAYDRTGDGKIDEVRVTFEGRERCYGEDTNHDGIIDTWDLMDEHGFLVKRASDTNGDGRVDRTWTFDPTRKGCANPADPNANGALAAPSVLDSCARFNDAGR